MLRLDADRAVEFCDGLRRRDFLHAGSLSALGLSLNSLFSLKALGAVDGSKDVNCIMLMLVRFAVMCTYAVVLIGLAAWRLRRVDA